METKIHTNFAKHLEVWAKHYPMDYVNQDSPIIRKLAQMSAMAKFTEMDIVELCETLSNDFDKTFQNGINAVQNS